MRPRTVSEARVPPDLNVFTPLLHFLRLLPFLFGGQRYLALENLALRQQLAVDKRAVSRPRRRCALPYWRVGLCRTGNAYRSVNVSLLNRPDLRSGGSGGAM